MTGWTTFAGQVVAMEWGGKTYTILPLPKDAAKDLAHTKRVEGEIGDYPINLAITTAPVWEGPFLWAGKSLLQAAGIQPGERLDIRLRAADPDAVDTPEDLAAAIRAADKTAHWTSLSPGKRRGHIYQITQAKRPETRAKHIALILDQLS